MDRKIRFYLRKNWKWTTWVGLLQVLVWGMQVGVQVILIRVFDAAFSFDFPAFVRWILISVGAWGVYFLLGAIQSFFQARAIAVLNNQVRYDLLHSLWNRDHVRLHAKDTGEYLSWLTNNLKQLERLAWNPFFESVGRASQILWSIVILAWIDWVLLVAALATALIMWLAPKLFHHRMETLGKAQAEVQAEALGKLKSLVMGLDILRVFEKPVYFFDAGVRASREMETANARLVYTEGALASLLGFVNVSLQILSQVLIVILAFAGRIPLAVLAAGSNLIGGVTNGFNHLAHYRLAMASSKPYLKDVDLANHSLLDEKSRAPLIVQQSIVLKDIGYSYGSQPTLKNVNMEFKIGGKYAIVGPSGSGKSTLLKILLGWLRDYEGEIWMDGVRARDHADYPWQKQMSYIDQNVYLFNTTIQENIALGATFPEKKMDAVLRDTGLAEEWGKISGGLDAVVGENGKYLSGGQKQRIAIARSLIHDRSILFMDEGTGALDAASAHSIEDKLLGNREWTVIMVSHHLTPERMERFDKVYRL